MQRLLTLYRTRFGSEPTSVELLPLSGSARKYYRMAPAGVIGCIGTNLKENRAFLTIDAAMRSAGVAAPEVYGVSPDGMAYIQEDLGDGQLFALLVPSIEGGEFSAEEKGWLRDVMAALPALQYRTGAVMAKALQRRGGREERCDDREPPGEGGAVAGKAPSGAVSEADWGERTLDRKVRPAVADGWDVCFPDREFNFRMVSFDLNYFKYCYLKESGVDFDEIALQDDLDLLISDSLKPFGQTFMYRDFQARNIMIRDGKPHFIDFQGGRRGPVQYDLASFLFNAGTRFPEALRHELENVYLDALAEFEKVSREEFFEHYRLITLVRLLQEFGAYGFRGLIEKKQLFIDCIAPAQKMLGELVAEPFERYPYLTEVLRKVAADEGGILKDIM